MTRSRRLQWRLLHVRPSDRPAKKLMATFESADQRARRLVRHFGAAGHGDFTRYWRQSPELAKQKRRQYIARHARGNENWNDPTTPAALSRYLLWEKPTLRAAIDGYRARFSV